MVPSFPFPLVPKPVDTEVNRRRQLAENLVPLGLTR
jgi:hypothetical protein